MDCVRMDCVWRNGLWLHCDARGRFDGLIPGSVRMGRGAPRRVGRGWNSKRPSLTQRGAGMTLAMREACHGL